MGLFHNTDLKIKSRYSKTITTAKTTMNIIMTKNRRAASWAPSITQIFKDNKIIKDDNNKTNNNNNKTYKNSRAASWGCSTTQI